MVREEGHAPLAQARRVSILRTAGSLLKAVLADSTVVLSRADLFTFTLQDGVTVYRWTSWDTDLTVGGNLFQSKAPWLKRSSWNLVNTMEVPKLKIFLLALNDSFAGGVSIKGQLKEGLFDGAAMLYELLYMITPGDSSLGTLEIFRGVTSEIEVTGLKSTITCKGKNNLLDQYMPRNVYQLPCNHAFCDPGCTLLRASFTFPFTLGGTPTRLFLPWAAAPGSEARFQSGSVEITSGPASGSWRTIVSADSSGLTLAYPLSSTPLAGDTFTAFQGCDKTVATCDGTYANLQHYRGFPFIPPPDTAY